VEFLQTHKKLERDMSDLNILKNKKPIRVLLMFLGVVVASITCVNPASADETVSLNGTTLYRDFQVYSGGGSYEIRGFGDDPVVQLYRGTSIAEFNNSSVAVSGDFLAVDDDSGSGISGATNTGLDAYLSGTFSDGLGTFSNYVIRVTSYDYWIGSTPPTESYTFRYTGFSSGSVDARSSVRQTHNHSFASSLYGSDKLSDPDGQLKKTVDSINKLWGSLIK
jgi:hypothetical protein